MKKNIFLLSAAVFMFFISACGATDDDGIFAGSECTFEGSEICSDNGVDILECQSSTWTIKKECNISIGKKCKQGSDGSLGCFGEGENGGGSSGNSSDGGSEDIDASDSDSIPDNGEENPEPADTEESDEDNIPEDPENSDDTDSKPQPDPEPTDPEPTDPEPTDPEPTIPDDAETPDNDTDSDTDSGEPETPAGQCSSNSDCSGSTPYCSISTSQCIANAVFITEYVEGSGDNKSIEIYNGSKSSVNLTNFTIQQSNNGKGYGATNYIYSIPASSISSGKIFVFCNANSTITNFDKDSTSAVFQFNGNDAIALFDGALIVDQIGNETEQIYWSVAGVAKATENHTLRRKTSVIQGTADWAASAGTTAENSQWEVLDQDTFDGLGQR